ncbi:MAG: peptidase, partial [Armatimonadota bacterium]|nr:peptidase [Armatimonadota bacterium]
MPSDKERNENRRDERRGNNGGARRESGGNAPRKDDATVRAIFVLDEILKNTDPIDSNYQYLLLLRHQLELDEKQFAEAQKMIEEYDEAYTKLTSPANRVAVFLSANEDGTANIAMGDNDFYTNVDPNVEVESLQSGTRVKVNDAYAIVGDLGPAQNGQVVKVTEALEDGRLRIGGDMQGMNTRVVVRGAALKDIKIKTGSEVRMEPNFRVALEAFAGKENQDFFLDKVTEIPWDKIGGQQEAIGVIKDAIELPLLYP